MSKRFTFRRTRSVSKRGIARPDDRLVARLLEGLKHRSAHDYWSKGQSRVVRVPLPFWWSALVQFSPGDQRQVESGGKLTTAHTRSSKEVMQYTSGCSQRDGTVFLEPDHRKFRSW